MQAKGKFMSKCVCDFHLFRILELDSRGKETTEHSKARGGEGLKWKEDLDNL